MLGWVGWGTIFDRIVRHSIFNNVPFEHRPKVVRETAREDERGIPDRSMVRRL